MGTSFEVQFHDSRPKKDGFTFIPYGLKSEISKEAVRVHVLHGRKRNDTRARSSRSGDLKGRTLIWDSKPPSESTSASLVSSDYRPDGRKAFRLSISRDHDLLANPFCARLQRDLNLSPRQVSQANFLVDHCSSLPSCLSSTLLTSTDLHRLGQSYFPAELLTYYWCDAASFKAFLAHAATLFSLETNLCPPVNVEELMCNALGEIRSRLSDEKQRSADGTVLAIAILANVEEGREQKGVAAMHWRGLRQVLRLRGEFEELRMHRGLHTMLLWREILTSNSEDFCLGHGLDEEPELQKCNEHLVQFFDAFAELLDQPIQRIAGDIQGFLGEVVNRKTLQQCDWTSSMQRRAEIACLVYLAMLAISAGVSAESRGILERVRDEVIACEKSAPVDQPQLLFIMLRCSETENVWHCQRLWQLSRCVYLTRKLRERDWKTIRNVLSLFLGVYGGEETRDQVVAAWKTLAEVLLLQDGCHVGLGGCHARV